MTDRTSTRKKMKETTHGVFLGTIGTKNPAAVALGRLGGKKGGPARAKKLSATKRKLIARKAAIARWKKG
jgi:hypothetical protein